MLKVDTEQWLIMTVKVWGQGQDSQVHGLIMAEESCLFTIWAISVLILTYHHNFVISLSCLFISFENVYFMVQA